MDQQGLGALLMEILVDEVKIETAADRHARPPDQVRPGIDRHRHSETRTTV